MERLGAQDSIPLLVCVEDAVERAKRVTEEAVCRLVVARGWSGADVVGALVVTDENRATGEIVDPFGMRRGDGTGANADEQADGHDGRLQPRPRAGHRSELSDAPPARSSRRFRYARRRSAPGCTRTVRVSEPCAASPST